LATAVIDVHGKASHRIAEIPSNEERAVSIGVIPDASAGRCALIRNPTAIGSPTMATGNEVVFDNVESLSRAKVEQGTVFSGYCQVGESRPRIVGLKDAPSTHILGPNPP
jgi:hypothetical protein